MAKKESVPQVASDDTWRIEEDLRTLRRACEVMKDSKRLNAVKKLIGKEQTALEELVNMKGLRRDY